MTTTIRRNAFGKIADILSRCEFIRCSKFDDMTDESGEVTADEVILAGREHEFERVYLREDGSLTCVICRNWSYTGYPSLELAAWGMTEHAQQKYNLPARIAAKKELAEARSGYSRPLTLPRTSQEGLANVVQLIINQLEAGDTHEALMQAVNLLDDVRSKSNPYRIGNAKPRAVQPVSFHDCGNID